MDTTTPKVEARSLQLQIVSKRLVDLVGSLFGLILLAPAFVVIAILIRTDSPGPIFFRQKRMGLNGQHFQVLKFRTMVVDAENQLVRLEALNESEGGILFKMKNDPRVTRIGEFLRRTSIDELPQLINVLLGEMSLVGPRPLQERDCERAHGLVEQRKLACRQSVLPGMTGLWQIRGRSELNFDQMLQLDLEYVDRWSLWFDLYILLRTVLVVLASEGAY